MAPIKPVVATAAPRLELSMVVGGRVGASSPDHGDDDGFALGCDEGLALGPLDGRKDGHPDGSDDGPSLGVAEGF